MDRHRSLFKGNSSVLSPRHHNRLNRELQEANRAKQRQDRYHGSRNISVSPVVREVLKEVVVSGDIVVLEDKENAADTIRCHVAGNKSVLYKSSIAQVACAADDLNKLTRREQYLKRFIEWKRNKKQQELTKKTQIKKQPFVAAVAGGTGLGNTTNNITTTNSFAPNDHQFKAPVLKKNGDHIDKKLPPTVTERPKGRPSIYTVAPTPPPKLKANASKNSSVRKALPPPTLQSLGASGDHAAKRLPNIVTTNTNLVKTIGASSDHTVKKPPPNNVKSSLATTNTNLVKSVGAPTDQVAKKTPLNNVKSSVVTTNTNLVKSVGASSDHVAKGPLATTNTNLVKSVRAPTDQVVKGPTPNNVKSSLTTTNTDLVKLIGVPTDQVVKGPPPNNVKSSVVTTNTNLVKSVGASSDHTVKKPPPNNVKSSLTTTNTDLVKSISKPKSTLTTVVPATKSRPLKMSPPPVPPVPPVRRPVPAKPKTGNKATGSGAVSKAKVMQSKRIEDRKPPLRSPHKNAKLTISLKAKKPVTNNHNTLKRIPPKLHVNGKSFVGLMVKSKVVDINTPRDVANVNPFEEFVTSTKLKTSSQGTEVFDTISPVEPVARHTQSSSGAKRALLRTSAKDEKEKLVEEKPNVPKLKSKFNFVRYSMTNISLNDEAKDQNEANEANDQEEEAGGEAQKDEKGKEQEAENGGVVNGTENCEHNVVDKPEPSEDRTPTKMDNADEERPVNYLSPFVTVSRGKVNAKKENERRNSIYLQTLPTNDEKNNEFVSDHLAVGSKEPSALPAPNTLEVRRTLETVRYFRKQLKDEIGRLHALCDKWEAYKDGNLMLLEASGGDDMIHVTVGQTKLLTSKKFMQFRGLIDRCESGVTGVGALVDNGSEDTKPITAIDLEGFWAMLGLQIDNIDKRFENLERWKANEWRDPDEVAVDEKMKKTATKIKKTKLSTNGATVKAKSSSALQQMLRNIQMEMRKKKAQAAQAAQAVKEEDSNDVILTPTRKPKHSGNGSTQRQSGGGTPGRIPVIVKDRKSRSMAATVIMIPTPNRRTSMMQRKVSEESPKLSPYIKQFKTNLSNLQKSWECAQDLRKAALLNNESEKLQTNRVSALAASSEAASPPCPGGRKSILKTPGTAKGKTKSVIFDKKLRIKKFKFTVEDEDEAEADDSSEEDDTNYETFYERPTTEVQRVTDTDTDADADKYYSLRTRKVQLRPSSEIVVPK